MSQSDHVALERAAVCADCDEIIDDFVWEHRAPPEVPQSFVPVHANRHECHRLQANRRDVKRGVGD